MSPDYYWNIFYSHILDTAYYIFLYYTDPSNIVQQRVTQFADKYKSMLTLKEYHYLTKKETKSQIFTCFQNYIKGNKLMK